MFTDFEIVQQRELVGDTETELRLTREEREGAPAGTAVRAAYGGQARRLARRLNQAREELALMERNPFPPRQGEAR